MQEHAEGPMSLPAMICPVCGAKNEANHNSCDNCGAMLAVGETDDEPAPTPNLSYRR